MNKPTRTGLCALLLALAASAWGRDPFDTAAGLPPPPDLGVVMGAGGATEAACPPGAPPGGTITLADAVARALCQDPRTRQTWAQAHAQAAQLGVESAAYLPQVNAALDLSHERLRTRESGRVTRDAGTTGGAAIELSWTLFDFGQREAVLQSARQTLLAATATHDAAMQEVFLDATNAYFALLAAQGALAIAKDVEQFDQQIVGEADKLLKSGDIEPVAKLQAQTAVAQAALDRGRAEGELRLAQGRLAVLLGHGPQGEIDAASDDTQAPDLGFLQSIDQLLAQAQVAHPEIKAARLRVEAAVASAEAARKAYRPTLSLAYGHQRFREVTDAHVHDRKISLQLNIPLFDGFERSYRQRAALAEADAARAEVAGAQQKVALEVWEAYHGFKVEAQALADATHLLELSNQLLQSEQALFRKGEGDMLDLLDAQGSKAGAALEQLQSRANWHAARLRLAASLGRVGFWALQRP
jgi:outer membrane protein